MERKQPKGKDRAKEIKQLLDDHLSQLFRRVSCMHAFFMKFPVKLYCGI